MGDEECAKTEGTIKEISMESVTSASKGMKAGKACGPSEVRAEMTDL